MANNSTSPYVPILFLDTNAVHFARLFLRFARRKKTLPFVKGVSPTGEISSYAGEGSKTMEHLIMGMNLTNYLLRRIRNDSARLEYSPITKLEMVCGLLKGASIQDAAKEGVHSRWWGKMDEVEMLHRLRLGGFSKVTKEIGGFEQLFKQAGLDLIMTDPKRLIEVWILASDILKCLYLDVGDSIIFASAILTEAEEVLTNDGYLRKTVNHIENPNNLDDPSDKLYYRHVRNEIKDAVSNIRGIKLKNIKFPKAPKPKKWR